MELENIVANTVYIKAKKSGTDKDKGRSRRWKSLLAFPHISLCTHLREHIDVNYNYVVGQQPIGKRLFWIFCKTDSTLSVIVDFLDAINKYTVSISGDRYSIGREIFCNYISSKDTHLEGIDISNSEEIKNVLEVSSETSPPDKLLYLPIAKSLERFLSETPFNSFTNSIYFDRYLQWKWLERLPITKHTFRMYRVLGKGGFGEVCACQVRATGKLYACKKMEKKRMKKRHAENMAIMEKAMLQKVNSRFVVSLAYTFETKDALCLVLTIMNGGDLKFHIHNMSNTAGFSENRARFYAAEITMGVQHMHAQRIVYRDLKPENILIDDQGHVRISDLGLAVYIEPGSTVKGRVGTAGYMAPEVVTNSRYTFSPDWFGLGCIVYEMIMGQAPFRRRKERVKREEVDRRVCEDVEEYNYKFSDASKRFCQALLQKNPLCRLGCDEAGADGVKSHSWFSNINWSRLEAGLEEPPFLPDPHAVYAKDVLDIEQFSTVKGVTLDAKDMEFYKRFCSGAVSIPWQNEMIDTGCFEDLNEFYLSDGVLVDNLNPDTPPPPVSPSNKSWFKNLFHRKQTNVSVPLFDQSSMKHKEIDLLCEMNKSHTTEKGENNLNESTGIMNSSPNLRKNINTESVQNPTLSLIHNLNEKHHNNREYRTDSSTFSIKRKNLEKRYKKLNKSSLFACCTRN